jgi:glutathione S-transferase
MRALHHFSLQPLSRRVRLQLREKKLDFDPVAEKPWERREGLLRLNPAGETPVLVEEDGSVIASAAALGEYLEEVYAGTPLLGQGAAQRAETRRLVAWFDGKFEREVTQNLFHEKIMKRLLGQGGPDSSAIRAGKANIHMHLDRRNWLAGDAFSLADIAAAAQVSVIDYLGDIAWDQHREAALWYARVKSRPSFRPILADHLPGTQPPPHYADLDF